MSKKKNSSERPASPSTRERILAYLKENRTTSSVELAYAWGLTRADLRYQLKQLHTDGWIEPAPRDPDADLGPGRPVIRYRLAERAAEHSLTGLCKALLAVLAQPLPPEERAGLFQKLAEHLAGAPPAGMAMPRRLAQAVQTLNAHHYHARWEAHARGPRVLLRNCPYAPVLAEYPELCQMDRDLLEKLLDRPAKLETRMNSETGQPPACIFAIGG